MPYPLGADLYSPYGPVATFLVKGVQPPAAQYIGPSDQLQLTVLSPNVAVNLMLGLRLLDLLGQVSPLQYAVKVPATAATPFKLVITPGESFLLSATIGQANVRRGRSYCTLLLQRGQPTGGAAVGDVLISGYPSSTDTLGFPQTPATSCTYGRGAAIVVKGVVPGLGLPAQVTVPPGTRWRFQFANVTRTDTGGGTAPPILTVTTAGGDIKFYPIFGVVIGQPVPNFYQIWFSLSMFGTAATTIDLNAGDVISCDGEFGMVADNQYSALSVTVEEFAEI